MFVGHIGSAALDAIHQFVALALDLPGPD